jgi:hypothetical protein
MSVQFQFDKHFIAATKNLVANVITSGQVVGPYDNDTKVRPRLEVDFEVGEQPDGRMMQNANAVWYPADYVGAILVRVCTNNADTNHANYVGEVRRIFATEHANVQAQTNTYYEVQSVLAEGADRERDDTEDEIRTAIRFRTTFSLKPW